MLSGQLWSCLNICGLVLLMVFRFTLRRDVIVLACLVSSEVHCKMPVICTCHQFHIQSNSNMIFHKMLQSNFIVFLSIPIYQYLPLDAVYVCFSLNTVYAFCTFEHHILMWLCVLVSFIQKILTVNRQEQASFLGQHTSTTDEYFVSHGHRLPYFPALLEDGAQKMKNGWQKAATGLKKLAASLAAQAHTFNSMLSTWDKTKYQIRLFHLILSVFVRVTVEKHL